MYSSPDVVLKKKNTSLEAQKKGVLISIAKKQDQMFIIKFYIVNKVTES